MESNPCLDVQLKPVTVLIPSTVTTDDALAAVRRLEEAGIEAFIEAVSPEIPWHTRELMKIAEDAGHVPILLGGPSLRGHTSIGKMIEYRGGCSSERSPERLAFAGAALVWGGMQLPQPEPMRIELTPRIVDTDWMTFTYAKKGEEKVGERRTPSEGERARNKKKRQHSKKARKIARRSRK